MVSAEYYEDVLKARVLVAMNGGHEEVSKFLKRKRMQLPDPDFLKRCDGCCDTFDMSLKDGSKMSLYFIWVRKNDMATLLHEIHHLVGRIFEDRHIPVDIKNDEIFAYYAEYWFDKIHKLTQTRAKKKKK